MAAKKSAKIGVTLKRTMKYGMFGIKLNGIKHVNQRNIAKKESVIIRSKVKVICGQGHCQMAATMDTSKTFIVLQATRKKSIIHITLKEIYHIKVKLRHYKVTAQGYRGSRS